MIDRTINYIIIGSSAAGISALNTLARLDPTASLLCISANNHMPYNTCFLIDVIAGIKSIEQILLRIMSKNVQFLLNTKVIAINRTKKSIITSDNSEILYQKLIIATGVRPKIPLITGMQTPGVFQFHTLHDAVALRAWIQTKKVQRAVIVGGGLTGIECADMLHRFGSAVTIVEQQEHILSHQLSANGAKFLAERMRALGITILYTRTVCEIIGTKAVTAVLLDDGQKIAADLVIMATGVQPNSEIAQHAGLACHHRYILVNTHMQTSDPAIYAAGDVVAIQDQTITMPTYTWADAVQQGSIAAHAVINTQPPNRIKTIIHSSFFGLQYQVFGAGIAGDTNVEKINNDEYVRIGYKDTIPVNGYYLGNSFENIVLLRQAILQPIVLNHR